MQVSNANLYRTANNMMTTSYFSWLFVVDSRHSLLMWYRACIGGEDVPSSQCQIFCLMNHFINISDTTIHICIQFHGKQTFGHAPMCNLESQFNLQRYTYDFYTMFIEREMQAVMVGVTLVWWLCGNHFEKGNWCKLFMIKYLCLHAVPQVFQLMGIIYSYTTY